jgi:hypothetical protein
LPITKKAVGISRNCRGDAPDLLFGDIYQFSKALRIADRHIRKYFSVK